MLALVVFGAAMSANRGEPFEFVHSYIKPTTAMPGGTFTVFFVVKNVTKTCGGDVRRTVVDAEGNIWTYPTTGLLYTQDDGAVRQFARSLPLDERAAPGPAIYHAKPRYWCNVLQQHLWPIEGVPQDIRFTITGRPS